MDKEIRKKLIWKYFWKRKREEIWGARHGLLAMQIIGFLYIGYMIAAVSEMAIGMFLLYIAGIELIFIILYILIVRCLMKWLCTNWELATKDADEELNRRLRKWQK